MKSQEVILVFILCIVQAKSDIAITNENLDGNQSVTKLESHNSLSLQIKAIQDFEKEALNIVQSATKTMLPYFVQNSNLDISPQCMGSMFKMFSDFKKLKIWTLKLIDSFGKLPSGVMEGTFAIMGDYDECLGIAVTKKGELTTEKDEEIFHGQYCTIKLKFPGPLLAAVQDYGRGKINLSTFGKLRSIVEDIPLKNYVENLFSIHLGACVPSTCSPNDTQNMMDIMPLPLATEVVRCESNEKNVMTLDQKIIIGFFSIFGALLVIGTSLDGISYLTNAVSGKRKSVQFLLSFSVYTNTKKFLKIRKDDKYEIGCVNGMYILGATLVVLYHTYFLPHLSLFSRNIYNLGNYFNDVNFTLISTLAINMEAYFVFSGLFLVYPRWVRSGKEGVRINIPRMLFRRYIRLFPALLLIIGIILLLPLFGSGPIWNDIFGPASENCRKYWWTHMLIINNFLDIKDQCFLYFWFIPCLMQVTIIAAFLTFVLARNPRLGVTLIIVVAVGCSMVLGILTALNRYPPSYALYFFYKREKFETVIYTSPLSHVGSFCIGMLLGFYMAKHPKLKMNTWTVSFGWILSFFCLIGVQYIIYIYHDGNEVNPIHSALYAGTHKIIYSLGIAWIILACSYGYGGFINRIFSWKVYGPLSKLGYFTYLVHYVIINYHVSVTRERIQYTHLEIWMRMLSYLFISFLLSYLLYITFEVPLNFLESFFISVKREEKVKGDGDNENSQNNEDKYGENNNYDEIVKTVITHM